MGGECRLARCSKFFHNRSSSSNRHSTSDGFDPVRHRLGVAYEDDCLKLGLTWRHVYQSTGDARSGNGFLLSLSFKNLGR